MIYQKIVSTQVEACYYSYERFWYVIPYNDKVYIHYSLMIRNYNCEINYLITGNTQPIHYKPQDETVILKPL